MMKQPVWKRKLESLKTLDCFVMDNSLYGSAFGELRGHTLENKFNIYEEVKKCGFENIIIVSFGHTASIDDFFLEELVKRNEDMSRFYAFSDLVSIPVSY